MKKIVLFFAATTAVLITNAQTVKLKKGQVVTILSTMAQEIDMGMAGQMNNNSKTTSVIQIKDADKNSYKASSKVSKMNISVDGMGQSQTFDSENPEDMNGDIGKALGGNINKEVNVTIDNISGKVVAETTKSASPEKKEEDDPMSGLMNMFANGENDAATTESVIYILPKDKKIGDTWQDSSEVKNNSKIYKTYTLKSLQDGIATVGLITKSNGKTTTESQGMQIDMTMDTKADTEIIVDTNTSIIKKINKSINIDGTMEVMGQSLPITSKVTEVVEIN